MILFIPDGLRGRIVTPESAPAMAEIRDKGVNFKNSHSLFPTFTMANGSAMSSGHYLGDTGTFSNTIYTGYSSVPAGDTVVPFIENDAVLGDIDEHFNGDYLNEETILKMARARGFPRPPSARSARRCCSIIPTAAGTPSWSTTPPAARPAFPCPTR